MSDASSGSPQITMAMVMITSRKDADMSTTKRAKSNVRQRQAQVAVRLLPHEDERVRQIANEHGISSAAVVRKALEHYLDSPSPA